MHTCNASRAFKGIEHTIVTIYLKCSVIIMLIKASVIVGLIMLLELQNTNECQLTSSASNGEDCNVY